MRAVVFTFPQGRAHLSKWIEHQRELLPDTVRTRQRQRKDGTKFTEHYAVGASLLSDGCEKTMWAVVRMAIQAVEQVLRVPMLALAREEQPGQELPTVPPLQTNAEYLSQARVRGKRVSARTIRNHIQEGLQAGIIVKKQWRGWQNDFYLWINPEFVFKTWKKAVEKAPDAVFSKAADLAVQAPLKTNFPPYNLQATYTGYEIEIGQVDKLVPHEFTTLQTGHTTGYTGAQPNSEAGPAGPEKGTGGTAGAVLPPDHPSLSAAPSAPKKPLTEWQTQMAQEFWVTAWRELYYPRGQQFSEEQQARALEAIVAGVYLGFDYRFSSLPPHQQRQYHEQALERLGLAAAYFSRNRDKYPPLPWAEYTPGAGYFDAENSRGFVKTLEWHEKHLLHRMQRATAEGLRKARRVFTQHGLGKAPKRYQQKCTLDLYRHFERQFARLGQPALHRFRLHFDSPPATTVTA